MASTTKRLSESTINNTTLDNDTRLYTTKDPASPNPIGGYTTYAQLFAAIQASGGFMTKAVYDANDNGIADNAEKVDGVDAAQPKQYYGKNSAGDVGFHFLPAVEDATGNIKNVIYVGKNGADAPGYGSINSPFLTVKYALSTITDAGNFNRYLILVGPGVYVEDNPVQCKSWVDIAPMGGELSVVFEGQTSTEVLFTLEDRVSISGCVAGRNSSVAASMTTPGLASLRDIIFADSTSGVLVDSTGAVVYATNILGFSFLDPLENLVDVRSGRLEAVNIAVVENSVITNVVKASGPNSVIHINVLDTKSTQVNEAIFADNTSRVDIVGCNIADGNVGIHSCGGAEVHVSGGIIDNFDTALTIPTGHSFLGVHGVSIIRSRSYDLKAESPNAKFRSSGCVIDQTKLLLNTNGDFLFTGVSSAAGDEALFSVGEFHVGIPERPSESAFGEGDSYTRGQLVYGYDGTNFINYSAAASSFASSTFSFPNTSAGAAIYWASDLQRNSSRLKHYGIKVNIEQAASFDATNSIIFQYWDGTSWVGVGSMMTDADSPYLSYSNDVFTEAGSFQIRYSATIDSDWAINDPIGSGTDRFWVRAILVEDITQNVLIQQTKLHTNRTELNEDGWLEYFGRARPIGKLNWDAGLILPANATPASQDVYLSDNLAVGRQNNSFAAGAIDRLGFTSVLPLDTDTGCPISVEWTVTSNNTGGDILWVVRWGYTTDGNSVYFTAGQAPAQGPNEQNIIYLVAGPTATFTQFTYSLEIDVQDLVSRRVIGTGDTLWLTLERTGPDAADTHPGSVALININATYYKWSEGGHTPFLP